MKKKYIFVLAAMICVVFFLAAGIVFDHDKYSEDDQLETSGSPYIEISPLEKEVLLVGDVVHEWTKWNISATDLYNTYRENGRIYTSKSVMLNWAVYNIPNHTSIVEQRFDLATDESFDEAVSYELSGNARNIKLDYLFVDTEYYFRITAVFDNGDECRSEGSIKTAWSPRIVTIDGLRNVRDIGGWTTTDGKQIKQGLLYRGCELDGASEDRYLLTESGKDVMLNQLNIKADFDLRASNLPDAKDMLGENVPHYYYSFLSYTECFTDYGKTKLKSVFSDLANPENYPVYLHCSYGADRTGTVCYFLEALLGLSEEDLYREWELSILQNGGAFYEEMEDFVEIFKSFEGDTMQEKAEKYLLSIGVTQQEINSIREIFLGEDAGSSEQQPASILEDKKIVYDGDSICAGVHGGGGYAQLIADRTGSKMVNYGNGGVGWYPYRKDSLIIPLWTTW